MLRTHSVLTSRDEAILGMVFSYDGVATHHIQQRFFPTAGARSACYCRIGILVKAGYLTASRIPSLTGLGTGKAFLTTTGKAKSVLVKVLGIELPELWRGTRVHSLVVIDHHLALCDLRLCFELAVEHSADIARMDWTTEHILRTKPMVVTDPGGAERISLIPDGQLTLTRTDQRRQPFFIELDRSTITEQKRLRRRLRGYLLHAKTEAVPVLFVVPTERRLTLLARLAEQEAEKLHADSTLFMLATQDRLTPATVLTAPVWHVPGVTSPIALAPSESPSPSHALKGAGG